MKISDFAGTDREREVCEAVEQHGGIRPAAKALKVKHPGVHKIWHRVKARAAKQGHSPEHDMAHTVPDGYLVDGVSTLYGDEGQLKQQWVKSRVDRERQHELYLAYMDGLCKNITPRDPAPAPRVKMHTQDMMAGIFIGDAHIGMRAFGRETKHSDFDTGIATAQLREGCDYLVEKAEPTETGLLVNVGDFMHANTQHNTTFSGTPLDVDTRHNMVMEAAGETLAYMVDRMLTKFKKVVLVCARGNHDTDAAGALALMMRFYYRQEPRVEVLRTDGFYHYIEYGNWLLGIHHGDKQKPESLAGSMARDMPRAWGRTTHRMWCVGHFHKDAVKTLPGVKYKVFGALPPPDSWHASHGYAGDGEMEMWTFKRDGGVHSKHSFEIPQPVAEPDVAI